MLVATVRNGKIAEINRTYNQDIVKEGFGDPTFRLVDISRRADIKVGDSWPPTKDPNDLIHYRPGTFAVVKAAKVVQVVLPADVDTHAVTVTQGIATKHRQRLKHNPLADSSVTLEPVPDGVTVNVGDSWPPVTGA